MAARMAMMAITTSNSINVKPRESGALAGGTGVFMVSVVSHRHADNSACLGRTKSGFLQNYKSKVAVLNTLFRGD
jgi:proteasome assembly chaperone (PAC2) family protein